MTTSAKSSANGIDSTRLTWKFWSGRPEFSDLDSLRLVLFEGLVEQLTQFLVVGLEFYNLLPVMSMQRAKVTELYHACCYLNAGEFFVEGVMSAGGWISPPAWSVSWSGNRAGACRRSVN